ncbi:MAG: response regulator [Anaerolineae bacterium]|nr:response regulator [Anaerolineae bacterium]
MNFQSLKRIFRPANIPPPDFDPLEIESELERKRNILNVLSSALVVLGVVITYITVVNGYQDNHTVEFLLTQTLPPVNLFLVGLVTWVVNRIYSAKLAGYVFTIGYGLTVYIDWIMVTTVGEASNAPTPAFLGGLTILLAGVLISGRAALVTAALLMLGKAIVVRLGSDLFLAPVVFWCLIALVSWQYEKTLRQTFARLRAARDHLEDLVAVRTRELERAKEEAEAANVAKSAFLANMSHELRTPMNAILGFAQLMERSPDISPAQQENLGIISRSGEHLLQLINDVLEMSKIEAGRTTLNVSGFDLYLLLDSLEDMLYARAESKGLLLSMEYAFDVPRYIRTDESKLRQVLLNLLSNAIKFTEEGGVTLNIECDPPLDQSYRLRFKVADTGHGVAPAEMHKLFEAFSQTTSGETLQEGTGLGLAISRQFVQLMGGTIQVESEVGKGSIFTFDVVATLADDQDMNTIQYVRRVTGLAPGQPAYRILIAEDKWENRTLLRRLLEPVGFELREAKHGKEAVEIAEKWQPHLIFMDMRMPVMDGHEATRKIKSTLKGQAIAIIALTASVFEHERMSVLEDGCDDFVRKPFRETTIFEKLAQHLGVKFIYEEKQNPSAVRTPYAVTLDSLKASSPDWISRLHHAASMADSEESLSIIAEIRQSDGGLAASLQMLVNEFRFDKIIALTHP